MQRTVLTCEVVHMSEPIVFQTPKSTRRSEMLFFVILLPALGLIVLISAFTGVILYSGFGVPMVLSILVGIWVPVWVARMAWQGLMERLRYDVTLGEDNVQLGSGRSALAIPYKDVDLITVPKSEAPHIRIHGLRSKSLVYLSAEDALACADALRQRCPSAVYVAPDGTEFFPPESQRPLRNLLLVERRCFRIALLCFLAAPFSAAITFVSIAALFGQPAGAAAPNRISLWMLIGGFLSPWMIWQGWRNLRKSREARQARMLKQNQGIVDE
jgi:hypothetical protein